MQKKLLVDIETEIAKGVTAYARSGKIEIYINHEKKDFSDKNIKIEIFKRQLQHWFFNAADTLIENEDNDFILMMICAAYVESIQQYKTGKSSHKKSKKTFLKSLKEIFKVDSKKVLDSIYGTLRCGLFHNSMVNENVRLTRNEENAITESYGLISINCVKFYEYIKMDFENYIKNLNNASANSEIYSNFDKMFTFEEYVEK